MIQHILIVMGLVLFIEALFDKWGFWYDLHEYGVKKNRFVYDLTSCMFCVRFHLSWITTLILCLLTGFEDYSILIPFIVSGLTTLKDKKHGL